jgi:hypothetical protein
VTADCKRRSRNCACQSIDARLLGIPIQFYTSRFVDAFLMRPADRSLELSQPEFLKVSCVYLTFKPRDCSLGIEVSSLKHEVVLNVGVGGRRPPDSFMRTVILV